MTGYFVRVTRDGKRESVEIDELTDEELDAYAATHPEKGWNWARAMIRWIRDNVSEAK